MTTSKLLKESGIDCTTHGFRTSFRSWCAAAGYSLRKIAALVGVSHETVRTDLAALLRELNERYPPTL